MFRFLNPYKQAFRRWLRSKTRPYSIEEAEEKRYFLAKCYTLLAWTALGMCAYNAYKYDVLAPARTDLPRNIAIGIEKSDYNNSVRFITTRGFNKVQDITYSKEEIQELKNKPVSDTVDSIVQS